jgi:hypothetical protein
MEGKIDLSARRQVTNKLRDAYGKASKTDKDRILDEVQAATGSRVRRREGCCRGRASRIRRSRSTGGSCGLARMGTRRVSSWLMCGS